MTKLLVLLLAASPLVQASRQFQATSDTLIGNTSFTVPTTGSIAFAVNPQFSQTDGNYHIMFELKDPGSSASFSVMKDGANNLILEWFDTGGSNHGVGVLPANYSLPMNTWSYLAVTWTNGGSATLWLNGTALTGINTTVSTYSTTGFTLSVGNRYTGTYDCRCKIAGIGVWSRIITSGEVATLNAPNLPSMVPSGLYAEYDLVSSSLAAQAGPGGTLTASAPISASDPPWAVPSLSLTGPSTGTVSAPSSNFTVTEANLAATTVITPSDSSGGGSFSPSTVTLTSGSPSATFTYTAASAGAKSISITNNQSISNPSAVTYTAVAATSIVTFPNANLYLSPYTWRTASGAAFCPMSACYIRLTVTGTTQIVADVDTSINSGAGSAQMPIIKVVVNAPTQDGLAAYVATPANNTSSTLITLASGLNSGTTYTVLLQSIGGDESQSGTWTGTIAQLKLNGLRFDSGATLSAPATRTKNILFLGDSYLQGYFGQLQTGPQAIDASLSWPFFTSWTLGGEYGQTGVGSQGWVQGGNGGYPAFPSAWNYFDSSHPKTFSPAPDYVFVAEGINDHGQTGSAVTSAVTSWIASARSAFGAATKIFIVLNIAQVQSSAIVAGVTAAADPLTYVIDPGSEFAGTVFNGASHVYGVNTWASADGLHLDSTHQQLYTAFVVRQAQKILSAQGASYAFAQ